MFIISKKNTKIAKSFQAHREDVIACLEKFDEFMRACFDAVDKDRLASLKSAVDNSEAAADGELRHAVDLMSEDFLPSTRASLISIIQSTDGVANLCQEVVRRILLEKIKLPACLHDDLLEIISITKNQLGILYDAVDMLFNDYKSLFNDRKILDDVRTEESKVDVIEAILHTRIFDLELDLCEKIYYRNLIERICDLSDVIENIADKIQILLVEREG